MKKLTPAQFAIRRAVERNPKAGLLEIKEIAGVDYSTVLRSKWTKKVVRQKNIIVHVQPLCVDSFMRRKIGE